MLHHLRRTALRHTASFIVLGLLGSLAGCGGGGGGSDDAITPAPINTPTLQSIEVTPSLARAAAGTKAQFVATGVYTDNSTQDLTEEVTWNSSNGAVATMSNDAGACGVASTAGVGTTTVSASSGSVTGETMLTVTDATLVSIQVTPASPGIANGQTQQFTATGLYTDNSTQNLTAQVTWESSDGAVATVSNDAGSHGRATSAGVGSTTVSASSGRITGATTLTVTDATLVSIEVSTSLSQVAAGTSAQFTATGLYTDNSTQDLTTQVTWNSSDEAVATVSNDAGLEGMASALAVGSTTVSASSNGVTGAAMWTVTDATLVSIEVSPAAPGVALGLTQQFTATGRYTDNTTQDLTTQVTWDSSDDAVATVSNAGGSEGEATTVAIGSTTVSASSGSVTGEATLTVTDATLVSIEVTPAAPILANGLTLEFTATGLYTDDSTQGLTSQVTWDSSNDAVATVSNADGSEGLATTAGVGSTTVSASIGSVTGETTLTVTDATLVSIEVTPADPSIASGLTQEFTATGHYTDDSTQVLTTQVTWSSSDTGVATVSNADGLKGLATAAIVGTATVYATSGVVIGETTLTVTDATLVSIEVTPATPSLANGLTQQFTAIGRYTDDSTQDLTTQVIWDSSNDAVATVSNAPGDEGLATTAGVGSADVSATSGVVTGQTTLTVTGATLVWIDVTPAAPSITSGLTQPFTAMGHYTDSSSQDLTALATWGSSEPAVATVSNAPGSHGVATGVGAGSTNVSASSSGVTGATTLTVTAPVLMSIDVTPADPSIANGATRQFTATGLYNNGSTQDLTTQVIWSSSNDAVATVSNTSGSNGLATAAGVGTATVYATSGSVTGDTTLTVIEAPPPPPTVEEMVAALLAAVTEIGGPGGSLVAKVRNVQNALPDFNAACNALVDFKDEVSAQNGKKLTPEQAEQLTADAVAIELAIPCSQF